MHDPLPFWSYFSAVSPSLETSLRDLSPGSWLGGAALRRVRADLMDALWDYHHSLTLDLARDEQGFCLTVSADGAVEDFEAVRTLIAAAPEVSGWRFEALRPRRQLGAQVVDGDLSMPTRGLRFSYGLANDRMVALVLFEERPPVDPAAGQFLARRLVADLLGEEDDALWIADARLMSYEDWLAITPGGRSWPISEMTERFDAIFHPPSRRAAVAAEWATPLALSA
jgi:hypothetical protein